MSPQSIPLRAGIVAALLLLAAPSLASVRAQDVSYSGSLQYATGSYIFSERTHSVYLSNGLHLSTERVDLSASVPVIFQSTPWVSYTTVGGVPSGGPQQGAVRGRRHEDNRRGSDGHNRSDVTVPDTASYNQVGVGDPSGRIDVEVIQEGQTRPGLGLIGTAKAPLADVDRGFGTGAWDAGLGVSLSKRLGTWFLFGEAVYWWMGDMDDLALQNSVSYAVSLGRAFRQGQLGLLLSLSGYTAEIVEDVDPPLRGSVGVNYSFGGGQYSLNSSASFGLTESTPDASISLGWRVRL